MYISTLCLQNICERDNMTSIVQDASARVTHSIGDVSNIFKKYYSFHGTHSEAR